MGTRVVPTYTNLFMVHVYTHNSRPRIWLRFIDDIWGLFHGDKPEFNQF